MAQLFGKAKSTVNEHIKNIFKDEELMNQMLYRNSEIPNFSKKHQTIIILILS
jgi:hypothetical protein